MSEKWEANFEEMGGYDCMSDAIRITNASGNTIAKLDIADYEFNLFGRHHIVSEKEEARALATANATLMKAAPDLLAALEGIDDVRPSDHEFDYEAALAECRELARAAIAKAKGKS